MKNADVHSCTQIAALEIEHAENMKEFEIFFYACDFPSHAVGSKKKTRNHIWLSVWCSEWDHSFMLLVLDVELSEQKLAF